jgi:hypothetical protein
VHLSFEGISNRNVIFSEKFLRDCLQSVKPLPMFLRHNLPARGAKARVNGLLCVVRAHSSVVVVFDLPSCK